MMSQNLSSAAVVIGALNFKWKLFCMILVKTVSVWCGGGGDGVEEKWGICRERGSKLKQGLTCSINSGHCCELLLAKVFT